MQTVVITGHSGFLGSLLTEKLHRYSIFGISEKNSDNKKIKQIKKDIRKIKSTDLPKNISCIIHMAAITDVIHCNENPKQCFQVNVEGTQNMLEIARQKNSKFIFISTGHVYGKPSSIPIKETHPRHPNSIYATSKLAAETICEGYSRSYGLDLTILRLFSIYGPKSPDHLVTTKIISQILTTNTIQLGNLFPKRDFTFVDDVITAIEIMIKKTRGFNVYNIGTGKSHSILEICEIIKKIHGKDIPILSKTPRSKNLEINEIVSDNSKIKHLGWKPKTTIFEGLKKTYQWYKTQEK